MIKIKISKKTFYIIAILFIIDIILFTSLNYLGRLPDEVWDNRYFEKFIAPVLGLYWLLRDYPIRHTILSLSRSCWFHIEPQIESLSETCALLEAIISYETTFLAIFINILVIGINSIMWGAWIGYIFGKHKRKWLIAVIILIVYLIMPFIVPPYK